ncbi:hypothetical protein GCM10009634_42690 [Saccharothrix xinjiangensis]
MATRLALKLAPPIAATPRSAARLVTPLRAASAPAMTSHNKLWFAAFDNRLNPWSAADPRRAAERLTRAESRPLTRRSTGARYRGIGVPPDWITEETAGCAYC